MLPILYGILSAGSWGAGDFAGGLASRKLGALRAVLYVEFFGLLILVAAWLLYREPFPSTSGWISSLLGGALGSFGLLILYYSLSIGQMSIAAPVSALFAVLLPVIVGSITEGFPSTLQWIGFVFALTAIWLISQGHGTFRISRLSDLRFPILAGVGFGCYFIFIHHAASDPNALLWPMILSRAAGTISIFLTIFARREAFVVGRDVWGMLLANAILDLGGNAFYILASKTGRLDIAAVLSSLYPGSTVILAWFLLKERISPRQMAGILLAFAAIFLFTI